MCFDFVKSPLKQLQKAMWNTKNMISPKLLLKQYRFTTYLILQISTLLLKQYCFENMFIPFWTLIKTQGTTPDSIIKNRGFPQVWRKIPAG